MDDVYTSALAEMGISLTTLAVKGTATAINTKVKSIKDEKTQRKFETPMMKLLTSFYQNAKRLLGSPKRIRPNLIEL